MKRNKHTARRKRTFPLDKRTTRQVEETRTNKNRKPYRTLELKQLASSMAVKCDDGTFRSQAGVRYHNTEVRR